MNMVNVNQGRRAGSAWNDLKLGQLAILLAPYPGDWDGAGSVADGVP